MLPGLTLLLSVVGVLGSDCGESCNPTETCCPGSNSSEPTCCPFENAVCCEDGAHCCPEGSFCDLDVRMCGMFVHPQVMRKRIGDIEEEISSGSIENREKRDILDEDYKNEISNVNQMLVHCDLDQFCPYFSTCCHSEDDFYLCCPNREGVCCSDEMHCCKQGEKCDSQGMFCLSEVGLETTVRKSEVLRGHYMKDDLDFVESLGIERKRHNL